MPHPQWMILTIVAVMQGSLAQTLLRRNARVLATLVACGVVVLLRMHSSALFRSACFRIASGVAHAFFGVRYLVAAGAAAVIFPNDGAIIRLVGAMMIEQNDEWPLQRRCMQLEGLQSLCENQSTAIGRDQLIGSPA